MTNRKETSRAAATKAKFISPICEAELCCRMLEAAQQVRRPKGLSAEQALATLDEEDRAAYRRAAYAAMNYWREVIDHANATN